MSAPPVVGVDRIGHVGFFHAGRMPALPDSVLRKCRSGDGT